MSTEDYYKPYCPRCKTYVQPQVVAATSVYGGGHVSGGIGSTSVSSTVTYKKMCPTCGEEVLSQSDIDQFTAKQAADKEKAKKKKQTVVLILGILTLFMPIVGIIALIMAAKSRPLEIRGKIGLAIAAGSMLLWVVLWASSINHL